MNILKNAYEIKYSEKPDYTWYIKQFKSILLKEGYSTNDIFEWCKESV